MQDFNVVNSIHNAGSWLERNQELLLSYAVNIAAAIAILFIGMIIARLFSNGINKVLRARSIDQTVADFLSVLARYGVIAFTVIAALSRVGVQTASVIAVLGAVGLAVGLALQGSLSNFAAGVLLVTFRPFRVGEYVDIGGATGTVLSVQIFSTTLRTTDGNIIVVPNGGIISGKIINYNREPLSRSQFIIGVSYDADIDEVFSVLRKVVEAEERVLKDKPVVVALNEMGASTLNIVVRCWTTYNDQTQTYWDLMAAFKRALDANKIGIPYPQMDVHVYNQPAVKAESAE